MTSTLIKKHKFGRYIEKILTIAFFKNYQKNIKLIVIDNNNQKTSFIFLKSISSNMNKFSQENPSIALKETLTLYKLISRKSCEIQSPFNGEKETLMFINQLFVKANLPQINSIPVNTSSKNKLVNLLILPLGGIMTISISLLIKGGIFHDSLKNLITINTKIAPVFIEKYTSSNNPLKRTSISAVNETKKLVSISKINPGELLRFAFSTENPYETYAALKELISQDVKTTFMPQSKSELIFSVTPGKAKEIINSINDSSEIKNLVKTVKWYKRNSIQVVNKEEVLIVFWIKQD